MNYWSIYTRTIQRNCTVDRQLRNLTYWRDNLFAGILIYLLPFCFIALVPGLYLVFSTGQYIIAVIDLATLTCMGVIAFVPGIKLNVRKIIYSSFVFAFGAAQLFYLGLLGPGLLYLLTASIFSILIFPTAYSFWPAWFNSFICVVFTLALRLNLLPWPHDEEHSVIVWIAVSTNLVFLSFLAAALIPKLFNGLQETLDKESQLRVDLDLQQQSLQTALNMLQQKNGELEQFAYVASHDLKEPLRMIISFMGLLENKYGHQLDQKARTYINFAVDGGKRMQSMIEDLLSLSRSGRHDEAKASVNCDELLNEVRQNIFSLIKENQAQIIQTTVLPILQGYRSDLISLFQNLLSNAIKFKKHNSIPQIIVTAAELNTHWLFTVEDNGIGIKKENFEKVFEIFSRLHAQQTYEGTGIGLAVCRKVVEQHDGEIWIESEEGKGTVFYFSIKK